MCVPNILLMLKATFEDDENLELYTVQVETMERLKSNYRFKIVQQAYEYKEIKWQAVNNGKKETEYKERKELKDSKRFEDHSAECVLTHEIH